MNFSRPIGNSFSLQGKTYQVVERPDHLSCYNCAFKDQDCNKFLDQTGNCSALFRSDIKNVIFNQMSNKISEVKIIIPEGMEIDKENSTFECIKFKPARCKSWKEYVKKNPGCEEKLIEAINVLRQLLQFSSNETNGFLALFQLRLLRNSWIQDSITGHNVYVPYKQDWKLWRVRERAKTHPDLTNWLEFPTEEMCQEFIDCFKDLLDQTL